MASIQIKFYSASLKTRTNINVIVPSQMPDIKAADENSLSENSFYKEHGNFPVLYLLHGTFGDEGDWQRFSRIEDYARSRNLVVVMPCGDNSCFKDTPIGKSYETYLTKELPDLIEWLFPVSKKREDTYICGLSMGGNSAFRLGLAHSERYGYVISLSGGFESINEKVATHPFTVWSYAFDPTSPIQGTQDDTFWLSKKVIETPGPLPKLYLACGTEDFLYADNYKMHEHLQMLGYEHVFRSRPGTHNWDFWDREILEILDWLPITTLVQNPLM